jgi:geranyl-CoA carboxylase alpha subunit
MSSFRRILVANRGEIALRVIRSAQALGYRAIAVYSEADADSPHVCAADDRALLGPAPVAESYLSIERILAAARATRAEAIHPGYGFLSENAAFARACEDAGLVFIGPGPAAIELMGNKAAAKRRMIDAGVPCVPGYEGEDQSEEALIGAAGRIGFPLMVKAAAGGGGRGMRLVERAADLQAALRTARSEAANAFGSGELILEKAVLRPRHVELQVFADSHGNVIHLGERDCSVQRRHQKVVEEAPCPVMSPALRERMGAAAVEAARSIGYRGAGTVEFLLEQSGAFHFLEMNTRLQVEHPVTEMITGLDLVALQIRVAEGKPLGITQEQLRLHGHAIEARLYAEDPAQDFLPVTGRIELWQPAQGVGVRIDAGIASGQQVSPFYDPMLAKVIAWGENRDIANARLIEALEHTQLFGLTTNKAFLTDVLGRETFRAGAATTAFIDEEFAAADLQQPALDPSTAAVAAVLQYANTRDLMHAATLGVSPELLNWSSASGLRSHYRYRVGGTDHDVVVIATGPGSYRVTQPKQTLAVETEAAGEHMATLLVDGHRLRAYFLCPDATHIHLGIGKRTLLLRNELALAGAAQKAVSGGRISAPMHGVLLEVLVETGRRVEKGTRLAILEAMKMQHELHASVAGTVTAVHVRPGTQVAAGEVLIEIGTEGQ